MPVPFARKSVIPGHRSSLVHMYIVEHTSGSFVVGQNARQHMSVLMFAGSNPYMMFARRGIGLKIVTGLNVACHIALQARVLTIDRRSQGSEEHSDILVNLEAAQKHLDFLTSGFLHALDALPASVSGPLQTAPPPQQTQQQATSLSALASASAPAEAQKAKKVRTKRVPKGVVPGVTPPPDPERWLKKSERSAFAQGGRRRRGGGGGGATQGAMEPVGAGGQKAGGAKGKKKR